MTSDDQQFLDALSSLPNKITKYSNNIADSIDKTFDDAARYVRDQLSRADWMPKRIRPPKKVQPIVQQAPKSAPGLLERGQMFLYAHRWSCILAAAGVAAGVTYFAFYRRSCRRKRRARKASNGARKEVVVIAGPAGEPLTRAVALDLERRGFIVYVVVSTLEDETIVRNESRPDIRPLNIDILDSLATQTSIERFGMYLNSPQHAFPGAHHHTLHLCGMIVIPDATYSIGPVEAIPLDHWLDTLNVKILATIAMAQSFLRLISDAKARLLFLTPTIIPSLSPPFHAPEATVAGALAGFITSLTHELAVTDVRVCHFKLGTFDYSPLIGSPKQLLTSNQVMQSARADVHSWPSAIRRAYGNFYLNHIGVRDGVGEGVRGSPLRVLNNAIFDAMTERSPRRVWRVGSGSLTYEILGKYLPKSFIGMMMGFRSQRIPEPAPSDSVEWEKVDSLV